MIRPSSLTLAEHCELAPVLASEYPETNANIERGNLVDREVTRELLGGQPAQDPDAMACIEWLYRHDVGASEDGRLYVQEPISLNDPVTGELITKGTPDIVWIHENKVLVVDLKKREQYFAGRLTDVDRSLQLHAYALAWAIRSGASSYKMAYLCFGEGDANFVWSMDWNVEADSNSFLDRMRRIIEKSNANGARGTRPVATAGPHCTQCYQRMHCPQWLLPAHEGSQPSALAPLTQPGGLTVDNAGKALMTVMALEEAAEKARDILKSFVAEHGPIFLGDRQWGPTMVQGRRSGPSVSELEALNLMHLIKPGRPYQQWRIAKRK